MHSRTAAVKLFHGNFVAMYRVCINIYFYMILIQVTRFKSGDRKEKPGCVLQQNSCSVEH